MNFKSFESRILQAGIKADENWSLLYLECYFFCIELGLAKPGIAIKFGAPSHTIIGMSCSFHLFGFTHWFSFKIY